METIKSIFRQPINYALIALYIVGYYAYGMKGLFWIMAITIVPALIVLSIITMIAKDKLKKIADISKNDPERFKKMIGEV